jgi:hypothetical protein
VQSADVNVDTLAEVAGLIRSRNTIDARISAIICRPAASGHLGEWVASAVLDIQLEHSASARGIDGRFVCGALAGKTVNIKTYAKREGALDTSDDPSLDYYLVLCGPKSAVMTSRGSTRPWCIINVYLFDARELRSDQVSRDQIRYRFQRARRALDCRRDLSESRQLTVANLSGTGLGPRTLRSLSPERRLGPGTECNLEAGSKTSTAATNATRVNAARTSRAAP